MSRKSILLVSSAFYPENSPRSYRATELAKEFYRQGHEVTVLTKYRDHDYKEFLKTFPITFKMWGKPKFPRVPNFKKKPFSTLSSGVSRILSVLFEYPAIEEMFQVKKMLRPYEGFDLMISFAVPYPVQWGTAWARNGKKRIAKTWVGDCGDPYMFTRLDTFRKPFYFKYLEINFCKKCDFITVPFREMQTQFYPRFLSKIRVIPQGFNFGDIRLYEGSKSQHKPVFIFAGSIIPGKRDLSLFLDFIATLPRDFQFILYTNQQELFARYQEALGDKLVLRSYIDRLSLIYEMSKADFLVNVDTVHDSQANVEAIPSKLIDYALSNRPILNLNSSSMDQSTVLQFLDGDYSRQRIIDKSVYDITKVTAQFLILVDENEARA
jgi:hypothetical protein